MTIVMQRYSERETHHRIAETGHEKSFVHCRRSGGCGDVTVTILYDHSHSAWGIALYAQCFVVDRGISVGIATGEQYEKDSRYFVCQGKDRPLSSSSDEQGLELLPTRAACTTSRIGRFAQNSPDVRIAFALLASNPFSRRLMVAGTHTGPRGKFFCCAEGCHIIDNLHQQHCRSHLA